MQNSPRSKGPETDVLDRGGQPRPFIPSDKLPSPPRWDRGDDRWVTAAKQVLVRCQREFFNQVDGQRSVDGKKDVEKELQQALLHTRRNTPREQKKEIRRWAIDQHISEVETKVRIQRREGTAFTVICRLYFQFRTTTEGTTCGLCTGSSSSRLPLKNKMPFWRICVGPDRRGSFRLAGALWGHKRCKPQARRRGARLRVPQGTA